MDIDNILNIVLEKIVKIANPEKVILFGSYARHEANPDSDIDLMVIKRGVKKRRKLAQDIYVSLVGIPAAVDIIVETPERLEKHKTTPGMIYKYALSEGLVIYEH
jgi:predicted nucleotidyltransferase